jgi:CBS-domain-containing membrane protein
MTTWPLDLDQHPSWDASFMVKVATPPTGHAGRQSGEAYSMTKPATNSGSARTATSRWQSKAPARPSGNVIARVTAVTLAMLALLVGIGELSHSALFTAPLAATAMLLAAMPATPPAQPRSVVLGHVVSVLIGLLLVSALGHHLWVAALAASLAVGAMVALRAAHAPAAATAALVVVQTVAPIPVVLTFLIGSLLLVGVAWAAGRLFPATRYPTYWW